MDGVQPRVVDRRLLDDEAGVGQELHVISGQREELTVCVAGKHCHPPISLLQRNKNTDDWNHVLYHSVADAETFDTYIEKM